MPGCTHPCGHDRISYRLLVSSLSFQLLAEVNEPAEAHDSKIIMVNSCVAFGCTNRSGSGVQFHKIPCDRERQKLWLIALRLAKPPNLQDAHVCSDHFLATGYTTACTRHSIVQDDQVVRMPGRLS